MSQHDERLDEPSNRFSNTRRFDRNPDAKNTGKCVGRSEDRALLDVQRIRYKGVLVGATEPACSPPWLADLLDDLLADLFPTRSSIGFRLSDEVVR
ncbi:MAG: hypothetical protein AAGG48_18775 [Planctomycetota bacterium]